MQVVVNGTLLSLELLRTTLNENVTCQVQQVAASDGIDKSLIELRTRMV